MAPLRSRDAARLIAALSLCLPVAARAQTPATPAPIPPAQAATPPFASTGSGTALSPEQRAEALIREGVELRRAGQDQQALERFRQAFELAPTPRGEAQMGLAEQALGRWLEADAHLRHASAATNDPWVRAQRAVLTGSLATVQQHVGRLEILGNVPGAELVLNGQRVATLPLSEPVRAIVGAASVELRAEGYLPVQRTVTITAGQLTRESIDLIARPAVAVVTPGGSGAGGSGSSATPGGNAAVSGAGSSGVATEDPRDRGARRPLPPAVFAVGATLTLLAAGGLVISGLDTLSARDAYVVDPTEARYNDGVGRELRTNVLIGTTAVLGVATLAIGLFATEWRGSSSRRAASTQLTLPVASARAGGVTLGVLHTF